MGSNPQAQFVALDEPLHFAGAQLVWSACAEDGKEGTIETRQATFDSHPQITVAGLQDGIHAILRQTLRLLVCVQDMPGRRRSVEWKGECFKQQNRKQYQPGAHT